MPSWTTGWIMSMRLILAFPFTNGFWAARMGNSPMEICQGRKWKWVCRNCVAGWRKRETAERPYTSGGPSFIKLLFRETETCDSPLKELREDRLNQVLRPRNLTNDICGEIPLLESVMTP